MRKIVVRDTAVVVVLTQPEAKALAARLDQHTGVRKPMALVSAEQKLRWAMAE